MTSFLFNKETFLDSNRKFRHIPWHLIENDKDYDLSNNRIENPFSPYVKDETEKQNVIINLKGNPCGIPDDTDTLFFETEISDIEDDEIRALVKKLYNRGWLGLGNDYLVVNIIDDTIYYGYITWATDITPYLSDPKYSVFSYNREHGIVEQFLRFLLL